MRKTLLALLLALCALPALAQCGMKNTAFKSGEFFTYNLYFNWKFVWVRVGSASMSTVQSVWRGHKAYRTSLITRSSEKADAFFTMRDTLVSYATLDLTPLYYRKGAREGGEYRVDELFYTYPDGNQRVRQHRLSADGHHLWRDTDPKRCVHDMLNIFMRARSFDVRSWKKGHTVQFPIIDGRNIDDAKIVYQGRATVKAEGDKKHRCLVLAYLEKDRKTGKYAKIVDFYVGDDANHIPVRLDLHLRFGSAKAFLVEKRGTRN